MEEFKFVFVDFFVCLFLLSLRKKIFMCDVYGVLDWEMCVLEICLMGIKVFGLLFESLDGGEDDGEYDDYEEY